MSGKRHFDPSLFLENNEDRVIDQSAPKAESSCEQRKVTGCQHWGSLGEENSSRIPWLPFFFPDKDSICHWAICSRQVRISMISNQVCLHLDVTSISARKSWRQGYILPHSRPHPAKWHLLCSLKGWHFYQLWYYWSHFFLVCFIKIGEFCYAWFRCRLSVFKALSVCRMWPLSISAGLRTKSAWREEDVSAFALRVQAGSWAKQPNNSEFSFRSQHLRTEKTGKNIQAPLN